jgi:hypothetical protein
MNNEPSLHRPQMEFVQSFMRPEQLQRMLIYFSKQKPTDLQAQHGFSDVIVRLINDPLTIIFGEHGVYLFSNYLIVYPYNELDASQLEYITHFIRMHVPNLPELITTERIVASSGLEKSIPEMPLLKLDVRVTKQMGGGYTVRPVQISNIRLDALDVLTALVRGIMCGSQKHDVKYRKHAVNLQLQRVLTRVVISRAQLMSVNQEISACIQTSTQLHDSSLPVHQEAGSKACAVSM